MSRITASTDIQKLDLEEVSRYVDIFCQDVVQQVNGGLDFETNFNAKTIEANFTSANTTLGFGHGLKRVPIGYIQVGADVAVSVFDGTLADSADTIYLQASVIANVRLLVY